MSNISPFWCRKVQISQINYIFLESIFKETVTNINITKNNTLNNAKHNTLLDNTKHNTLNNIRNNSTQPFNLTKQIKVVSSNSMNFKNNGD